MKRITWFLSLCLLFAWPAGSAPLPWLAYDKGLEQAHARRKPLMIQVYADWCHECHQLSQDMLSPPISRILQRSFVLARINLGSDKLVNYQGTRLSEKQLATRLQATWPPMLLFYTHDGRLIGRKIGYTPPDELQKLLETVARQQAS